MPGNENVEKLPSDIQDADQNNDADLDDESGEDKEADKDNFHQEHQTSKDHETTQGKEIVKDHETETNQDDIELSGCKKLGQDIHSTENNERDESDVVKKEQNQTENIEMMPQIKDVVLQIDEVCISNQDAGLTRENSDQEEAKQSVDDALIASEENVVIEMDTKG